MRAIPRPQPNAALIAHGLCDLRMPVSMETASVELGEWIAIYANAAESDQRVRDQAQELRDQGKDAVAEDVTKSGILAVVQLGRCGYDRRTANWTWELRAVVRVDALKVKRGWPVWRSWTLQPEEVEELRRRWVAAKNKAA